MYYAAADMKEIYTSSGTMSTATVKTSVTSSDRHLIQRFRSSRRNHTSNGGNKNILPSNPLQQAIFRGCVECIRVLIETPPYYSVDGPCGPDGLRPIHLASRQGHLHVLRFLHSSGASLETCDIHGYTGLHHAVIGGQLRAVRWLLRHGVRVNCSDIRGRTPLEIALDHDYTEIVNLLSKHNTSSNSGICQSNNQSTILYAYHPTPKKNSRNSKKSKDSKHQPKHSEHQDSGNSSLATTASSSSPSCSCSEKSEANSESDDTLAYAAATIGGASSKRSSSSSSSKASFYLHPPRPESFYLHPPNQDSDSSITASTSGLLTLASSCASVADAESSESTSTLTVTFAEEPPEMPPVTPVCSGGGFLGSKSTDEKSPPHSPTPTPSPPPPPPKTVRIQSPVNRKGQAPPPPPPPPPMPDFNNIPNSCRLPLPALPEKSEAGTKDCTEENEYEDIDDVAQIEVNKNKLNRSVSAPPPPPPPEDTSAPFKHNGMIQPKAIGMGKPHVPFIPPNFPDPPKDALIKPSEYLKSIQQQSGGQAGGRPKFGKFGGNSSISAKSPCNPKIEETIKMLNGTAPSGIILTDLPQSPMSPVPEETNAEEELEEINPDCIKSSTRTQSHDSSGIRAEELRKVQLRKTPTSRTLSAPPACIGRVLPDENNKPTNLLNNPKNPRSAIIAELEESSSAGGVREWKEELKRRQAEEEKNMAKEMASIYSPLNFVSEVRVPEKDDTGAPIPPWKIQMLAKKAAERARREAEEQRRLEAEAKRVAAIPIWRRQLLQKRDTNSGCNN